MYPYLLPDIFGKSIALYDLMIGIGVFLMFIYIANRFDKTDGFTRKQTNLLLILVGISLASALLFSYVFAGIFHSIKEGELTFGSITFFGGLIGGISSFLILLKYFYKDDNKDTKKIMNTIITGVVLAHVFGRIGCFFAGCCYGIPTDSFIGVYFPTNHVSHTLYGDTSIFPTQLFEAFFLLVLFVSLNKIKKLKKFEIETYMIGYGIWRILIEFIRGDDRGNLFPFITTQYNTYPTPSQFISVLMIIFGVYLLGKMMKQKELHT
jgi:phosphatidylglycerol:prolipoprotein diacylglycerol transferase